jgi:hypothetical protein
MAFHSDAKQSFHYKQTLGAAILTIGVLAPKFSTSELSVAGADENDETLSCKSRSAP